MKQALPEDVFAELGKQAGIHFTPNNQNMWESESLQNGIDIDFTNKPFWSAVREACGLWSISPQPNYNNTPKHITIGQAQSDRAWDSLPAYESMGCFVQAVSFTRVQTVSYGGQGPVTSNNCNLQLKVYLDPALRVQSFNPTARVREATDDAGHSMVLPPDNNRNYNGGQQRSLIYECNVPLKYPDNAGKKIANLKFDIPLRASTKGETLSVDKPLEATETEKAFGDITVIFQSLKKNPNGYYEAKVAIERTDDDNMNNDMWSLMQIAQLVDAKGRPFQYAGGGGGGGSNGHFEFNINYSNNGGNEKRGDPVKWSIELPLQPKPMKIPVEFKDLALP